MKAGKQAVKFRGKKDSHPYKQCGGGKYGARWVLIDNDPEKTEHQYKKPKKCRAK